MSNYHSNNKHWEKYQELKKKKKPKPKDWEKYREENAKKGVYDA